MIFANLIIFLDRLYKTYHKLDNNNKNETYDIGF